MILDLPHIEIFLWCLPIVAFLYSSVGHGGASGYLALMSFFSFAPEIMKPTALLLNLFVSGIAFWQYFRAGYFNKKLFLFFAIGSIPLAFIGGLIDINAELYKKILGVLLVFAALKMLNVFGKESQKIRAIHPWQGIFTGAGIGFFSGLIGIGGGIILSPIILLMNWGKVKEAAAVSALFIWVNSAAGLAGQFNHGIQIQQGTVFLASIASIGALIGGYYGSKKLNNKKLKQLLAFVLLLAVVKLFLI